MVKGIGDYTGRKELSVHVVRSVVDLNISLTESHDYTAVPLIRSYQLQSRRRELNCSKMLIILLFIKMQLERK